MKPIQPLIEQLQKTWPALEADIASFQTWLTSIATEAGSKQLRESPDNLSQQG